MKAEHVTGDSSTAAATATVMASAATSGAPPACAPCCVVCPLSDLARGGCARVVSLAGAPRLQRRLMALGLRPSAELAVLGRAPGNGPLELRAGTVHLMLRACEAQGVMVEVDDVAALSGTVRHVPAEDAYVLPTV